MLQLIVGFIGGCAFMYSLLVLRKKKLEEKEPSNELDIPNIKDLPLAKPQTKQPQWMKKIG